MTSPTDNPFEAEEQELIDFMRKELKLLEPNMEVMVESWVDDKGGYRIAEITTWVGTGTHTGYGGTWMQSDPDAAAVLFAAERFVVTRHDEIEEFENSDDYIDYRQEMEQLLRYQITDPQEMGEWEDRRGTAL